MISEFGEWLAARRRAIAVVVFLQYIIQGLTQQAGLVALEHFGELGQALQLRGGVVAGLVGVYSDMRYQ